MAEMICLSARVHETIIRQAVPNETDEEVSDITHNSPTANPLYYPEWWSESRSMMMNGENNIDPDYERVARRVINSSDPIRLVALNKLALTDDDNDENLIEEMVNKCIDDHRKLVMETRGSYEEDDLDDN